MLAGSARPRGILRSKSERSSPTRKTSTNKKNVRFSDSKDLEQAVFAISSRSRYEDDSHNVCPSASEMYSSQLEVKLEKRFWLPNEDELRWLTNEQNVHLESVRWFGRAITGVVRVRNITFEKKVEIKYTYDEWLTIHTTQGAYSASPLSNQDQFSFCIFLPYLMPNMRVQFCILYEVSGGVFWDSNGGANYIFICRHVSTRTNPFFDTECSILF